MMRPLLRKAARRVRRLLASDSVVYNNVTIPAKQYRLGGTSFHDDAYFLASAQSEAERLVTNFGLTRQSHILDIGCGVGRLAIGLISQLGGVAYYRGIDVNRTYIRWCETHIARRYPGFQFIHIDVRNLRYNDT